MTWNSADWNSEDSDAGKAEAMDCDQVFDILTRGPFPTGTPCDEPVERHLGICAECQRLAEALRPAIELFQEAIDPEESRDLPGYWSATATERLTPMSFSRQEFQPDALLLTRQYANQELTSAAVTTWRMVALVAVGITIGCLLTIRDWGNWQGLSSSVAGRQPQNWSTLAASPVADAVGRLREADRLGLVALPAACFQQHAGELSEEHLEGHLRADLLLADASQSRLSCCSGCHHAGAAGISRHATVRVAQSCQYCHAEPRVSVQGWD